MDFTYYWLRKNITLPFSCDFGKKFKIAFYPHLRLILLSFVMFKLFLVKKNNGRVFMKKVDTHKIGKLEHAEKMRTRGNKKYFLCFLESHSSEKS